jgi:hypothetical protein
MLWEGSIHYHDVAVRWYAETLLLAQRHGKALPHDLQPTLQRMSLVALNFVHADGREPAIGDSDRERQSARALVYLGKLLQIRSDRSLPPEPMLGTLAVAPARGAVLPRVFTLPDSGFAIVRNTDRTSSFIIDYGPKGGWHGHFDLFSFELFDRGELLIVDPGRWLYDEEDPDPAWVLSTPAHNTIAINGQSHRVVEYADAHAGVVEVLEHEAGAQTWRLHVRHGGYDHLRGEPVVERRIETAYDGRFIFHDRVRADENVQVSISFLLPTENVAIEGGRIVAQVGNVRLHIDLREADGWSVTTRAAWHSPVYSIRQPATQLLIESTCSDCSLKYGISSEVSAAG